MSNKELRYGQVLTVEVATIVPDPENLREEFDEQDIVDLGRNLQEVGQMDEIVVFPILNESNEWTGLFDLHDGERRWRAAKAVGIGTLRARVEPRPSQEELLFKKLSRVLQTRTLEPERKVAAVEGALARMGLMGQPEEWERYRARFGGGQDWPQIVRVMRLKPGVRRMMAEGTINFTLAQSIGRLNPERQDEAARYVVSNRINGRYFSTQIVPYLLENPDASLPQAFEHTKVGNWREYLRSPYVKGEEPPVDQQVETFLGACVAWERAWEVVVQTGLVHSVLGSPTYEHRLKDAARRVAERAAALRERLDSAAAPQSSNNAMLRGAALGQLDSPTT